MRYISLLLLILASGINGFSQTSIRTYNISGIVTDGTTKEPLEFVAVSAYNAVDSTLIGGNITDEKGYFKIEVQPGSLYLIIEFISFQPKKLSNILITTSHPNHDTGIIELTTSSTALQAVEISGKKSESSFVLDKRVFNVGQDLSNRGGTAVDVLDNVPSVTVDVDGNVSLRGNGNVKILIDGKPSGMNTANGNNILKSLQASMIERIEVITNPSARYEAESMSGIINIILKKNTKAGINGNFEVSAGWPENYGAGANVNYRKGHTNFFLNYGINFGNSPADGFNYLELYRNDTTIATYTLRNVLRDQLSNNFRAGMDYSITENQTITGAFSYRTSRSNNTTTVDYYDHIFLPGQNTGISNIPRDSYIQRLEKEIEKSPSLEYSLNYTKKYKDEGHELNASVQYSSYQEVENSDYHQGDYFEGNFVGNNQLQRAENEEKEKETILTLDYIHPFSKNSKFETGLRTQLRNIINDYLVEDFINDAWEKLPDFSNKFRYNENVFAAYAIYGSKIGNFSYQAGLRAEYTDFETELIESNLKTPREYLQLFPSGHINYEFEGQNQVQFSYSRRIQRPYFWTLIPFYTFSDNRNISTGNPNLNPEYTDSYELGHIKYWTNGSIGTNIYWKHTTDVIQRLTQFNSDGTSLNMPINIATGDNTGLEFLFSYNPLKWLRLDGNANVFRARLVGTFMEQDLSTDNYSWFGRLGSKFSFWKNAEFQLRLNYQAPIDIPQGRQKEMYLVDVAFSKDFLQNNATFTLSARDLLNTRRRNVELIADDYYQLVSMQWRRAPIMATINYRLNMSKDKKRSGRNEGGDFEGRDM